MTQLRMRTITIALFAGALAAATIALAHRQSSAQTVSSTSFGSPQVAWGVGSSQVLSYTFRVPSAGGDYVFVDRGLYPGYGYRTYRGPILIDANRLMDQRLRAGYDGSEQAEGQADERPPSPPDRGLVAFAEGDFDAAFRIYSVRAAASPDDLELKRLVALADAARGNLAEAGRLFRVVYDIEPDLRHTPVPSRQVMGLRAARDVPRKWQRKAEISADPDAWFALAVLHHGAGNTPLAERLIARAEALR